MKNGLNINQFGTKQYYLNGLFHREDGPACEWPDGCKRYYIHGKLHREDGPAIDEDEFKAYFLNGKRFSEEDFWKENKKMKSLKTILLNYARSIK